MNLVNGQIAAICVTVAVAVLLGAGPPVSPIPLRAQNAVEPDRPPPPGRMVDVGGYRLHLFCTGSGSPTVVLLHGFGGYSFHWSLVQSQLALTSRVCAYDRAGQAWSDPGPVPRGLQAITNELHTLLDRSGERAPFVLVGQSWGGLIPRLYVAQHPNDVAGAAFVDATHEDLWLWLNGFTLQPRLASDADWARVRAPRARDGGPPVGAGAPSASSGPPAPMPPRPVEAPFDRLGPMERQWHQWAASRLPSFTGGDWNDIREDLRAVAAARGRSAHPFGRMPVFVLSAGRDDFEDEKEASAATQRAQAARGQADLATLSSNARHLVAANSGHLIQLDEPDLVVEAIRQVIDSARKKTPLCCRQ